MILHLSGDNKSGGFSKQGVKRRTAQNPVLCDCGKIDQGNLIGIKIGMVAQNYPPGVVLLLRYCRFIPSSVKLSRKTHFYLEQKAPKKPTMRKLFTHLPFELKKKKMCGQLWSGRRSFLIGCKFCNPLVLRIPFQSATKRHEYVRIKQLHCIGLSQGV